MKDILEFLSSRLVLLPCLREFFIFLGEVMWGQWRVAEVSGKSDETWEEEWSWKE